MHYVRAMLFLHRALVINDTRSLGCRVLWFYWFSLSFLAFVIIIFTLLCARTRLRKSTDILRARDKRLINLNV